MIMTAFPAETEYQVIQLPDGSFGVEVSSATKLPRTIDGFATQAEAEAWVFQQVEAPSGDQGLPNIMLR
jgi:hypothetical protein